MSEVKHNQHIISLESNKKEGTNLRKVKIVLKRALEDYEQHRRNDDEFFDIYEFLFDKLGEGFSTSTTRNYLNPNNDRMFEPEKLLLICDLINNYRPIDALISYFNHRKSLRCRS